MPTVVGCRGFATVFTDGLVVVMLANYRAGVCGQGSPGLNVRKMCLKAFTTPTR